MLSGFEEDCSEDGFECTFNQTFPAEWTKKRLSSRHLDSDASLDTETSFDSGYSSPVDLNQSITSSSDPLLSAHVTDIDDHNIVIKMEKPDTLVENDSTPDDLKNISFDEWDKNFIASFEENVFNLIDEEGKNLGFILSPKGKGRALFLSPEGKRLSPDSLRKKFATPSPLNSCMSILGNKKELMCSLSGSKFMTATSSTSGSESTPSIPQPKKQLFPLEARSLWKSPRSLMAETMVSGGMIGSEDLMTLPWPSQGKLQAARSRFSRTLEIAVQRTAQQVQEHELKYGPINEQVGINYPELRQALGNNNMEKVNDAKPNVVSKSEPDVKLKIARVKAEKTVSMPSVSAPRKPYAKENRRITTYSRIQPKQNPNLRIAFARFH